MKIEEYVQFTRKVKSTEIHSDYYNKLLSNIMKAHSKDYLPKICHICHTTERSCEIIILNDLTFLLYDQYLGQSMNMLNRIYLNSSDINDGLMYANKILAENSQLIGNPKLGVFFVMQYKSLQETCSSYKKEINYTLRSTYTLAQEYFVLLHEIYHFHINHTKSDRQFEGVKGLLRELIDNVGDFANVQAEETANSILHDRREVFKDRSLYAEKTANKFILLKETIRSLPTSSYFGEFAGIIEEDYFAEECICDELASRSTCAIMRQLHNVPDDVTLSAIYLGLLYLRLFSTLRDTALRLQTDKDDELYEGNSFRSHLQSFFFEATIRQLFFRTIVPSLLHHKRNARQADDLHRIFIKINKQYTRLIEDPILFSIIESTDFSMNQVNEWDDWSVKELNDLIDKTTGSSCC